MHGRASGLHHAQGAGVRDVNWSSGLILWDRLHRTFRFPLEQPAIGLEQDAEARLAGVIAVTDGRLHDPAMLPATAPAPVHVLLTGRPQDWDRRLVIEEAPAFGLIDQ